MVVEYYAPVANKQVELAVKEGGWVQCYGCCCYDKRDPLTKNWRELSVSKNLQKTKNGAIHVQCLKIMSLFSLLGVFIIVDFLCALRHPPHHAP